jgi:hypothetical protein
MPLTKREFRFGLAGVGLALAAVGAAGLAVHHFRRGDDRPAPAPAPAPPGVPAWAVIVVDDATTTAAVGKLIDGPTARGLKAAGKCRIYDADRDPACAAKGYAAAAKAVGLPALLLLDAGGRPTAPAARLPDESGFAEATKGMVKAGRFGAPPPVAAIASPPAVVNAVWIDPATGQRFVNSGGHRRLLTAKPSRGKLRAMLQGYGENEPVFPESDWYDLDRRDIFGSADWILDQDGIGECVGCGWSGGLRRCRVMAGMKDVKLSPGFLYSLINNGRDDGAVISDGIAALQNTGTCPYDLVGIKPIFPREMPRAAKKEAARYKLGDAYHADTWAETVSALMTGRFVAIFGVEVGNNWGRWDRYGVAGHDPGWGNHCLMADGVRKLPDGRWVLDTVNSWDYSWGPFKNGRIYLDKQHLFAGGDQPDVCVVRVAAGDPKEPYEPPVLKP